MSAVSGEADPIGTDPASSLENVLVPPTREVDDLENVRLKAVPMRLSVPMRLYFGEKRRRSAFGPDEAEPRLIRGPHLTLSPAVLDSRILSQNRSSRTAPTGKALH